MSSHNEKEKFIDLNSWCIFSIHYDFLKLSLFTFLVLSSRVHASQTTANVSKLEITQNTQGMLEHMSQYKVPVQVPHRYAFSLNNSHTLETFVSWSIALRNYGTFKLIRCQDG